MGTATVICDKDNMYIPLPRRTPRPWKKGGPLQVTRARPIMLTGIYYMSWKTVLSHGHPRRDGGFRYGRVRA